MSSNDKGRGRRSLFAGALIPLLLTGVLCANSESLGAQSITGLPGSGASSNRAEVLQMLRAEWGLPLATATAGEGSYPRVGDELTEGLMDPEVASETLIAQLHRPVKLINPGLIAEKHRGAIKKATVLGENRIRAAVNGLASGTHTGEPARQAVRWAFSEYLTTLETLIEPS